MALFYLFALLIFTVSVINLLRITVFSVLSDYYDIKRHRKLKKKSFYRPLISVVVPAHNERLVLERCLLSIYETTYQNFEVIVVDDGSIDGTARHGHYLRKKYGFKNLRIVRKAVNGGKASALNHGIRNYAKGKLIVAMDADCKLDRDALSLGAEYFRDRRINAVASNIKVMNSTGLLGVTQLLEYMLAYRLKKAHSVLNIEYLAGCTSFFRKSAIVKAGYYDEDTIAEDFDFSLKLIRRLGNSIVYGEEVLCYTEGVQTVKDLFKQRFRWRFGSFQAFFKNRNMFFNGQERLNKFLIFMLLPWLIGCELLFLLEPILLSSLLYYAIRYHYFLGLIYGFVLYGAMTAITIMADDFITAKQRLKLMFVAPFAYLLFLIINFVGYASLVKSVARGKGIVNSSHAPEGGWSSPERAISAE